MELRPSMRPLPAAHHLPCRPPANHSGQPILVAPSRSHRSCFVGCQYGAKDGGIYRILVDEDTAKGATGVLNQAIGDVTTTYTLPRCKLAISDRCACRNSIGARIVANLFPPPPPVRYAEDWNLFEPRAGKTSTSDTQKGDFGFLSARLVNSRSLDFTTRASFSSFSCPGEDTGERTCGLECSREHMGKLRAFTVQGLHFSSPPGPPYPSPPPPPPPPPFNAVEFGLNISAFVPCSNTCYETAGSLPEGSLDQCRDGGPGSFSPALCSYATQCTACGPRELVISTSDLQVGTNQCIHSNNGLCEDGRPSTPTNRSIFVTLTNNIVGHVCGYLTDA